MAPRGKATAKIQLLQTLHRKAPDKSFFCEITVVLLSSTFRGKCCDLIYQLDEWLQGCVFALSEKFCCTLCNDNKVYSILNAQKSFNSSEDPKDPIRWNGSAIKIVEFTVYIFPSESWYIFNGDLWYWYWYHMYYVLFGAHVHSCMLQWAALQSLPLSNILKFPQLDARHFLLVFHHEVLHLFSQKHIKPAWCDCIILLSDKEVCTEGEHWFYLVKGSWEWTYKWNVLTSWAESLSVCV